MSNNQQSTIGYLVEQCCEDEASYQDYSQQILMFVKANKNKEVRPVVDTIKALIKKQKNDSPNKVMALNLLHLCLMQSDNEDFLFYTEKKLLKRLIILARFRKESNELEKGALLFGKTYNKQASSDFLKLLLLYILKWGTTHVAYQSNGKQTEISKIFQQLQKERIYFPPEETVLQSLGSNYSLQSSSMRASQFSTNQPLHQQLNGDVKMNKTQFISNNPQSVNQSRQSLPDPSLTDRQSQSKMNLSQQSTAAQSNQDSNQKQQLEIARRLKDDYKKLNEYQSGAKLAEEILGMHTQGGADGELLLQFRGQLQEGKDFAESYLRLLMECPFQIKDKETKVEKILGIINEISTQFEKILIFKPYTKSELQELERKKKEEEVKTQQPQQVSPAPKVGLNSKSSQEQINQKSSQNSVGIVRIKKVNKSKESTEQANSEMQPQPVKKEEVKEHVISQSQPKQAQDFQFDQNIFKTNFAFSSQPGGQDFEWGTGASSSASQNFSSFNPIASNFEFGSGFGPKPTPNKLDPQAAQQPQHEQYEPDLVKQQSHDLNQVEEEKHPSVQPMMKRKNGDKLKSSSNQANIQLPNSSLPGLMNKVLEPPQDTPQKIEPKPQLKALKRSDIIDSKVLQKNSAIDKQFGITQKIFSQKPQITQQSPDQDEFSDDEEQLSVTNEKHNFKFPSPAQENQRSFQKPQNQPQKLVQNQPGLHETSRNSGRNSYVEKEKQQPTQLINQMPQQQPGFEKESTVRTSQLQFFEEPAAQNESPSKFDFNLVSADPFDHDPQQAEQLKEQIRELELKNNLLKDTNNQVQNHNLDLLMRLKIQLEKVNELDLKVQNLEWEKLQSVALIEKLEQDAQKLNEFDELYQQEKQSNYELKQTLAMANKKAEQCSQQQQQSESKLVKKEEELQLVQGKVKILEQKNLELQDTYETELEDFQKSETETKKQLHQELLESRKREENIRVECQREIAEGKKREETMRKKHENELKDVQHKSQEHAHKLSEMQEKHEQKENELLKRIRSMDQEVERLKQINQQQKQLLLSQENEIKRLREEVKNQVALNSDGLTPTFSVENEAYLQVEPKRIEILEQSLFNKLGSEVGQAQEIRMVNSEEVTEQKSKQLESQVEPSSLLNRREEEEELKDMETIEEIQEDDEEGNNHDISREEELLGQVPSSDSDREEGSRDTNALDTLLNIEVKLDQPNPAKASTEMQDFFTLGPHNSSQEEEIKQEIEQKPSQSQKSAADIWDFFNQPEPQPKTETPLFLSHIKDATTEPILAATIKNEDITALQESQVVDPFEAALNDPQLLELAPSKKNVERSSENIQIRFPEEKQMIQPINQSIEERKLSIATPPKNEIHDPFASLFDSIEQNNHQSSSPFISSYDKSQTDQTPGKFSSQQSPPNPLNQTSMIQNSYSPIQQHPENSAHLARSPINQTSNEALRKSILQGQGFNSQQFQTNQPVPSQAPIQRDISIDKSQFTTQNTEQLHQQQRSQQMMMDPIAIMKMNLMSFFRKSLLSSKAVIFEDASLRIGIMSDFSQPMIANMRLFLASKQQGTPLNNISLMAISQPLGFEVSLNKQVISSLSSGQQESVDVQVKPLSHLMGIPQLIMSYKTEQGQVPNFPVRLPVILLKFCHSTPNLDGQAFTFKWNFECDSKSEVKVSFNIDFNQCRSLTQLKENLNMGKPTFSFVDGVEGQQKNVICGGTVFQQSFALIKLTVTATGQSCEIVGKSSDVVADSNTCFAKFVVSNILEVIALKVNS